MHNPPDHPIPGRMGDLINIYLAQLNRIGWDIAFQHQPTNSPDCNTLDLAYFRVIKTLQYLNCACNIEELIQHVCKAFDEFPLDIC